ncbi:MAG TPA: hypothetical protein VK791_09870 [bacterium]|jgi:hypothetical protein|nr:hypothetical protein [bacterium]
MKLTKSSDAKPNSSHDLVFFIDRSLGQGVIASKLREAGYHVEIHDDHFEPDAPDEKWIVEVGQKNWIILTKDSMILHRTPELLAILKGNARMYVLASANVTAARMAEIFIKAASKIEKSIPHQIPPYVAKVHTTGSVEVWMTRKQLHKQFKN